MKTFEELYAEQQALQAKAAFHQNAMHKLSGQSWTPEYRHHQDEFDAANEECRSITRKMNKNFKKQWMQLAA